MTTINTPKLLGLLLNFGPMECMVFVGIAAVLAAVVTFGLRR